MVGRSKNQRCSPPLVQFRLPIRVGIEPYVHERHKRLLAWQHGERASAQHYAPQQMGMAHQRRTLPQRTDIRPVQKCVPARHKGNLQTQ